MLVAFCLREPGRQLAARLLGAQPHQSSGLPGTSSSSSFTRSTKCSAAATGRGARPSRSPQRAQHEFGDLVDVVEDRLVAGVWYADVNFVFEIGARKAGVLTENSIRAGVRGGIR
jgi:hypothetical protein